MAEIEAHRTDAFGWVGEECLARHEGHAAFDRALEQVTRVGQRTQPQPEEQPALRNLPLGEPRKMALQRGLNRVHHRILYFVGRNPDTSVNALLGILDVSKQALNGPLRQLVEMDLVAMRAATHDGRVKQVRLTYEGERLEARVSGRKIGLPSRIP